jgi:hypothetical protein
MQAIVIPLRVSGIGTAQRQIQQLGQNMARLSGSGRVGVGGGMPAGLRPPPLPPKAARTPPTTAQRLQNAILSTRIGVGANGLQIAPLVGRLLPLLGKFAGPIGIAAAALTTLAQITNQASENLREFRNAMLTGGGSATETALSRALGDSNGELAREFARTISSGGIAASYAARAGISDPGGELFGDVNKTKNLLKWAEALRKMSQVDAIRAARATGTEELLKTRDISKRAFEQLKQTAILQAQVNSPDKVRAAANFNAQLDRAKMNFESVTNIIGSHFMKAATPILQLVNGIAEAGIKIANSPLGKVLMNILNPLAGALGAVNDAMNPPEKENATKQNTEALRELAQVLRNGVYGGGERARSAIPRQWSGYNSDAWAREAMNLGAFTL